MSASNSNQARSSFVTAMKGTASRLAPSMLRAIGIMPLRRTAVGTSSRYSTLTWMSGCARSRPSRARAVCALRVLREAVWLDLHRGQVAELSGQGEPLFPWEKKVPQDRGGELQT